MSDHYRRKVGQFHRAMGVPRFASLNRPERMAILALRSHLISEEALELREADNAYRREQTDARREHLAKELADVMYVIAGTSDVLATPLWDPHQYWTPRPVQAFFAEGNLMQAVSQVLRSISELIRDIDMASRTAEEIPGVVLADLVNEIGSDLQTVAECVHVLAYAYGIPLLRTFDAVHASNLSKLDPATGVPVRREDGKILKGPGYRPVDLSFLSKNAA